MAGSGPAALTPIRFMPRSRITTVLPVRLRRLLRLEAAPAAPPAPAPEDPLLQAGRLLRQRREERGLSLRQLANDTRISTPVLEALERGWRDRLPEPAYLRTMVRLLEHHLGLDPGALQAVEPPPAEAAASAGGRGSLLARFTPGSIDVFTTWQGTVLYGIVILGLIYGVNLQQRRLAAANLLTLRPVPPLPASEQEKPPDPNLILLKVFPDLRPLQQAASGVARAQLQRQAGTGASRAGVLRLQLERPTAVSLRSDSGERTELRGASGELVLQLQAPVTVRLDPLPTGPAVFWDEQPVPAQAVGGGRYAIPPAASSVRP
jgi:hypothetical protein